MYIYQFPEIRPGLRVGNMDWFRTPKLFRRKLDALGGIDQIIINGPINRYTENIGHFQEILGIPILGREEAKLSDRTLLLYYVDFPDSLEMFTQDFGMKIVEYGKIVPSE